MTLSSGAKVQPKRSIFESPAAFRVACRSMLSERAPTPTRFIGDLDIPDRVKAKAPGNACLYQLDDARHRGFGVLCRDEVEVTMCAAHVHSGGWRVALIRCLRKSRITKLI